MTNNINWTEYDWDERESHPPSPGRYLIHRAGCEKTHFEQWNGSGWSSSNKDCTHWAYINPPTKYPLNIDLFKEETREDAEYPQEQKYPSGTIVSTGLMWGHSLPKVDECFYVHYSKLAYYFRTSIVKEILETTPDYIRFKTLNSVYRINIKNE